MAKSQLKLSDVDEYGFKRPENFDYESYGLFISYYMHILTKRYKKWEQLTEKYKKTNKTKRYVRKGIPISLRSSAWMSFSGARILQQESPNYSALCNPTSPNLSILESIKIDLPRTFPDNIFFLEGDLLSQQLCNVLSAFAHQNQEVGYCQGLNYIAGLLLLATKNEEATFWLLKVLVEQILPPYYVKNMSGLITDLAVLDELVKERCPDVHRHIKKVGLPWAVAVTKWFICLYAEVLPTETVLRIWDCLFFEGSKVVFRVALTLIKMHRAELLECRDLGEMVACFREMGQHPNVINCHVFIENVFKLPGSLSNKKLAKLRRKHAGATVA